MVPPVINTKRFLLKPYERRDEDAFIEIVMDELSQQFMGGISPDENEERRLFKKIFDIYDSSDARWFWIWGIYEQDKLCGHFELKDSVHTVQGELEIVYMIHPKERRRGIMAEVLLAIKEKQAEWGRTIIATAAPGNAASIGSLRKWGIARQELITDEETQEQYYKLYLAAPGAT